MRYFPRLPQYFSFSLFFIHLPLQAMASCNNSCGSLPVRYPFGTGFGCGSPLFFPSVTCTSGGISDDGGSDQLVLTTHTGTYPINSISYSTSTLTISPSTMSNCITMLPSTANFGLDWAGPFQLGPSMFVLLGCSANTSSLSYKNSAPICDMSQSHVCESLYSCPGMLSLGIPIFAPANSCCVYSPASLGPKGELDLADLHCAAYTSVMSYGDVATDPLRWQYGVVLKFGQTRFEEYGGAEMCGACESSGGVCGYTPPRNYFSCVCAGGVNSSIDCTGQDKAPREYLASIGTLISPSQGIFMLSSAILFFFLMRAIELQGLNAS